MSKRNKMAKRKYIINKNFSILIKGEKKEFKKGDSVRLSQETYNNWLKHNLVK